MSACDCDDWDFCEACAEVLCEGAEFAESMGEIAPTRNPTAEEWREAERIIDQAPLGL